MNIYLFSFTKDIFRLKNVTSAPYIFLFLIFLINLFLFWPGQMEPDSINQYNSAISGIFSDHHPPVMSILWKLLDLFHKGPGLLFLFHLILLYGSTLIFMAIFRLNKLIWLYVFLPLFPQIFIYSSLVLKDVGFAFSYLFVSALLSYSIMLGRSLNLWQMITILFLLFYGTAVKFQAIYICPILVLVFCYCLNNFKINLKTIFISLFVYGLIFFSIQFLHNSLIFTENKSHSWQLVKLYDLAAMSVYLDEPFFPDFIKNNSNFSFEEIKKKFTHEKVDNLIFPFETAPLVRGDNDLQRKEILYYWYKNIFKYPQAYLLHRFKNLSYIINAGPLQKIQVNDLQKYSGLKWVENFKFFFKIFSLVKFLKFGFLIPFILAYFILGLKNINTNNAAIPLIFMNGISIALIFVLFFFSMAGMLRYVYIAMCMFHASHGFAYLCCKNK